MKQAQTPHPLYDAVKSWKEAHKTERLIRIKVQNVHKNLTAAITESDEIIELLKQMYATLPKTDGTLYGVSPLAPTVVMELLMDVVFRTENKERNWSRRIKRSRELDFSKPFVFTEIMDQALAWAFKREKEDLETIT